MRASGRGRAYARVCAQIALSLLVLFVVLGYLVEDRTDFIEGVADDAARHDTLQYAENFLQIADWMNVPVSDCNHRDDGEVDTVQILLGHCRSAFFLCAIPGLRSELLVVKARDIKEHAA